MKMSFKSIGAFLGLIAFLPSNVFVLFVAVLAFLTAGISSLKLNRSVFLFFALILLSIVSLSFGFVIGNHEARQYLVRVVLCGFLFFVFSIFAHRGDQDFLQSFLYSFIIVATCNAVIVIITALIPEIYDLLRLRDLSGFDKSMRRFRSPGLFRGFDTSGIFTIFAVISLQAAKWSERHGAFSKSLLIIVLIVACALSSRTVVLLLAFVLILSAFLVRRSLAVFDRCLFFFLSLVLAAAGIAFVDLLFGDGSLFRRFALVFELDPDEFQYVYAVTGDDYSRHFAFPELSFFPERSDQVFDNFYARAGVTAGWVGVMGMLLPILCAFFSCMRCYRGDMRVFVFLFFVVFVAANFKNNYFYFTSFFSIMTILYLCRPVRMFSRARNR